MRRAVILAVLLLAAIHPACAQTPPTDLLLVLAVDASGSVDNDRFELQKHGYATAFRDPAVLAAIRATASQAIAVTMLQWTGPTLHVQVVGWQRLDDAASLHAFADAIDAAPRKLFGGGTSISGAIDYSRTLFAAAPFHADRRVIDVSGDGANNRGRPAADARDEAVADGIAINGLPILTLEPDLADVYRRDVIGGPGAFVIAVDNYDQFAAAILRKLVNEIATGKTPTLAAR